MNEHTSTPSIFEFDPTHIPYQHRVITDIRSKFDYTDGKKHEVLLSGSVGSAKSILMAHIGITHCLQNPGSRWGWFRRRMPDLKATILQKVIEHIGNDLEESVQWNLNRTTGTITFSNKSQMICKSWNDKQFFRLRSLELSGAGVEELTENDAEYEQAYLELYSRIGRLPHVKESILISATNPDSPSHWAYNRFINNDNPTRHVYYSVTTDNPFLPKEYVNQLLDSFDPKMAERMVYGRWVEISQEKIYYAYNMEKQFINDHYQIQPGHPIHICWDFNIGEGKPLSVCLFQYIFGTFHVFDEVIINGFRTLDSCEEMWGKGLLSHRNNYILHGDATGSSRDTRSKVSDWDIIRKFFSNLPNMRFETQVPKSNPPIRTRHNIVNSYCLNASGKIRLFVYKNAHTVDEGLRLTNFKKGGSNVEDDSKHYQHVTTALGYGIVATHNRNQASSAGAFTTPR